MRSMRRIPHRVPRSRGSSKNVCHVRPTSNHSGLLISEATLCAVEAAVGVLAGTVRADQLAGHPCAESIARRPVDGLLLTRRRDHLFDAARELREVGIGLLVGLLGEDEVVMDQFCDVGDCLGHGCNSFPFSVRWARKSKKEKHGGKGLRQDGRTGAQWRLGPPCGRAAS